MTRTLKTHTQFWIITLTIAACVSYSLQAHAGFEWLPTGNTPYSDTPEVEVVPPSTPQYSSTPKVSSPQSGTATQYPDNDIFLPMPGQTSATQQPTAQTQPTQNTIKTIRRTTPTPKTINMQAPKVPAPVTTPQKDKREQEINRLRHMATSQTTAPNPVPTAPATPIPTTTSAPPPSARVFETVSGFGSDMPLALALRQVVPPSYAFSFGDGVNPGYRVSWNGGKPWNEVIHDMIAPLNLVGFVRGNKLYINQKVKSAMTKEPEAKTLPIEIPPPAPEPATVQQDKNINDAIPMVVSTTQDNMVDRDNTKPPEQNNTFVYNDPSTMNPATEVPSDMVYDILEQPTPAPTYYDGRRDNITDPGQHVRPQAAQTMSRVRRVTNMDSAHRTALAEQSQSPKNENPEAYNQTVSTAPQPLLPDDQQNTEKKTSEFWEADQGQSLRNTLTSWADTANVELVWKASKDYNIENAVFINGSFRKALKTVLIEGLPHNKPAITYHQTPNGPHSARLTIEDQP